MKMCLFLLGLRLAPLRLVLGLVAFVSTAILVHAGNSALIMDSTRGDWVLYGQHRYYAAPDAAFQAETNDYNKGVSVYVGVGPECWKVDFAAADAAPLQPGHYDHAHRYPFHLDYPGVPGLNVQGGECAYGHGCNTLSGSFDIKELVFAPDGSVASFHAAFSQACEDDEPPVRGEIFYNSNDALPPVHRILSSELSYSTQHQFFKYQITSTEGAAQYQTSSLPPGLSLDAGSGLISGIPTVVGSFPVELAVTSAAGKFIRSWTLVVTPAWESTGPFTALRVFSEPGDPAGWGKEYFLTPDDGVFDGFAQSHWRDASGNIVPGITDAALDFKARTYFAAPGIPADYSASAGVGGSAPPGQFLLPGTYTATEDYANTAHISAGAGAYSSHGNPTGTFTIYDVANDGLTRLTRFHASFRQRCGTVPALLHAWAFLNAENVITSALRVGARQGLPFEYQIVANNHPTGFTATGLPPGLSIDTSTGFISGTPESAGDFDVQLVANGSPAKATDTLEFHIKPARTLKNISTRVVVGAGDDVVIGGFIISGSSPKRVLIRGIGPSLRSFGLSGVLDDPTLELHDGMGQLLITNDDWTTQRDEIEKTGIPPSEPAESGIVTTLAPGTYTAILAGKNATTGVGVLEIYDLDGPSDSMFGNISTRGRVGSSPDQVLIGGLIVGGGSAGASRVVIRGMGSRYGYGVPNELYDPTLELHDGNGTVIGSNDNWADTQKDELLGTMLAPSPDERTPHAAMLVMLPAGSYTAIVRGKGQDRGRALVEAYNLDSN